MENKKNYSNPEDKARDIFENYLTVLTMWFADEETPPSRMKLAAKQLSMITTTEVIESLKHTSDHEEEGWWIEVEKHIKEI